MSTTHLDPNHRSPDRRVRIQDRRGSTQNHQATIQIIQMVQVPREKWGKTKGINTRGVFVIGVILGYSKSDHINDIN